MGQERRPTATTQRVGREALRLLRQHSHVSREDVVREARVCDETAKAALEWLCDRGAPIFCDVRTRAWVLRNRTFAVPLTEPSGDDRQAVLTAAELLREARAVDAHVVRAQLYMRPPESARRRQA